MFFDRKRDWRKRQAQLRLNDNPSIVPSASDWETYQTSRVLAQAMDRLPKLLRGHTLIRHHLRQQPIHRPLSKMFISHKHFRKGGWMRQWTARVFNTKQLSSHPAQAFPDVTPRKVKFEGTAVCASIETDAFSYPLCLLVSMPPYQWRLR